MQEKPQIFVIVDLDRRRAVSVPILGGIGKGNRIIAKAADSSSEFLEAASPKKIKRPAKAPAAPKITVKSPAPLPAAAAPTKPSTWQSWKEWQEASRAAQGGQS